MQTLVHSRATRGDRGTSTDMRQAVLLGALLASALASGCANAVDGGVAVSSSYTLDTSYATSIAVSDAAWSDDWGAVPFTTPPSISARAEAHAGSALVDGGVPVEAASDPVSALRALARGQTDVCPGHVTVQLLLRRTPCGSNGQPGNSRVGATVTFSECVLEGGGKLDGNVAVASEHTASDAACDAGTTITVEFDAKITNLVYVFPSGRKVVIESLADSGKYDHALGTPPTHLESNVEARILRYGDNGDITSDHDLSGTMGSELAGVPIVATSTGTYLVHDAVGDGGTATMKMVSLEQAAACCQATGGTIVSNGAENDRFTFGPACGAATRNSVAVALGECP